MGVEFEALMETINSVDRRTAKIEGIMEKVEESLNDLKNKVQYKDVCEVIRESITERLDNSKKFNKNSNSKDNNPSKAYWVLVMVLVSINVIWMSLIYFVATR